MLAHRPGILIAPLGHLAGIGLPVKGYLFATLLFDLFRVDLRSLCIT